MRVSLVRVGDVVYKGSAEVALYGREYHCPALKIAQTLEGRWKLVKTTN